MEGDFDIAHSTARYAGEIEEIGYQAGILFAHAAPHFIQEQSEESIDIFTDDELCWIRIVGRLSDPHHIDKYNSGRTQGERKTQSR